jgi:predicted RND superfamily exporter protein
MAGWTRAERYRHLRSRTYGTREKLVAFVLVMLLMAVEIYGLYYTLSHRLDPTLAFLLIFAIILTISVGIFFVDTFWYESY